MKYGYFDDNNKEYVITTPYTPLPWINYLGNNKFFGLISNTGGGYHFYQDPKLRRITRYRYNNIPLDSDGRHYYIIDGDTCFSPSFMPCKTKLDKYECHHGLGYTRFIARKNNIETNLCCFVPLDDNCEIHSLTIKNNSTNKKIIKIFSYIEWCLWNAVDDTTNFQRNFSTGEVEISGSQIYHKTEYRERRNHFAFNSVNHKVSGYDTDREAFIGKFNDLSNPIVIQNKKSNNSKASGWSPISSFSLDIELEPNESKDLIFLIGYVENNEDEKWEKPNIINKKKAVKLIDKYNNIESVNFELNKLKDYWNNLLSIYNVKTHDDKLNRMTNIWNQYQCMVTFNMSRSASFYESGIGRGMGFRDSCQDLLGFVHLIPARARKRIIDIASIQMEDGSTWHQYQPLTKRGNADIGGGFNDDPLWLIACTYAYISETGDKDILFAKVPYNNDENNCSSLLEHLKRSINYTINNKGPHNLPLIGRADWNDCLNLNCFSKDPSESFQTCSNFESGKAESIFIAGMFVKYGKEYCELCKLVGEQAEANRVSLEIQKMEEAILNFGWDGDWFLRAYDAFEKKIGSKDCEEGKIFIEPQGMCVMAGLGLNNGYADKALDSVKKYLDTKYGVVLLQPAYSKYYLNLGEVSSYPPGYKENAGIFCHNNPWISIAEAIRGNADRAFEVYQKICPAYLEDISEIHRTEPYIYSQMIAGVDAPNFGEAKNSWLTGTAAWTFVNVSQYLLGIRPTINGLSINPCLPDQFESFELTRVWRNKKLHFKFKKSNKKYININGIKQESFIISENIENDSTIEVYY